MRLDRTLHARARRHLPLQLPPANGRAARQTLPNVDASFGYHQVPLPPGSQQYFPRQSGDQGVSATEAAHANAVTKSLLAAGGVKMVASYDQQTGEYVITAREGTVRYTRWRTPDGRVVYQISSIVGKNPIPGTDGRALSTLAAEIAATDGGTHGLSPDDAKTTYPDILRRLAQLFDNHDSPDLVYIPYGGSDPNHPNGGSHGVPDMTQSRAPLIMAGPGIARGAVTDQLTRVEDIAPTVAQFLGVRPVLGTNEAGAPVVQMLRYQDGHSVASAVADAQVGAQPYGTARRAIIIVMDGTSQTALMDEVAKGHLPNIAEVLSRGTMFRNGHLADYPTVTWANQNAIVSGASPGHSGIINNSWYHRDTGHEQLITDGKWTNSFRTSRLLDRGVETLYEAVRRSFGPDAVTAAVNHPSGRGATVSTLDLTGYGRLLLHGIGILRRYLDGSKHSANKTLQSDKEYHGASVKDNIATAIESALLAGRNAPRLSVVELALNDNQGHWHGPHSEQYRTAIQESDRNIGRILNELKRTGQLDSTMIVLTADHGMEQEWLSGGGGWFEALKQSGVKTVESTRFVYIKSMNVAVQTAAPLRAGQSGEVMVTVVNDDVDTQGRHKPVAGATVTITGPQGQALTVTTDANGVARIPVTPSASGSLSVAVKHPDFTDEKTQLPVGA